MRKVLRDRKEMATYYHVSQTYEKGDLLCPMEALAEGLISDEDYKWANMPFWPDYQLVCLFEDMAAARGFQEEYGGRIWEIELPDSVHVLRNAEDYACVIGRIAEDYIIGEVC